VFTLWKFNGVKKKMDTYQAEIALNKLISFGAGFYHSSFFVFIKILIGIYVLILTYDIVLLLIQRGIGSNLRELRFGIDMPSEIVSNKKKTRAQWESILRRLDSQNESEYKVAIIEADKMMDGLIEKLGYGGENMGERLNNIPEGQLDNLDGIREAHKIRNQIIHEDDFVIDKEIAKENLDKYADILRQFGVVD
jgi:hypothetical protein